MLLSRRINGRRHDRGSALIAVIALVGVTAIIAVTVGSVSVSALRFTNSVAASVEARGAAEAGTNAAELALRTFGACPSSGTLTRTSDPKYTVTIQYTTGSGWVSGCPTSTATQVRIRSTGEAHRPVFAVANNGQQRRLEAIYQYIPEYIAPPAAEPAMYAYTVNGVLKTFVLNSSTSSIAADLEIKTGNFACSNNAQVNGNVVLASGSADLSGCTVTGTVHASGSVKLSSSSVNGSVLAVGTGVAAGADVVTVAAGSAVRKDVLSGGNVSVLSGSASQVVGGVTAGGTTATKVTVAAGSSIGGNVLSAGTIANAGTISGTRSTAVVGLPAVTAPQVANWTDIPWDISKPNSFKSTTWYKAGFTNLITWTGTCSFAANDSRWAALQTYTTKTVVDATACIGGVTTTNNLSPDLKLKTDIVMFADKFRFDRLYMDSSSATTARKLYFIVPDNTADVKPSCTGEAGNIVLSSEANVLPTVSAFVYTPCTLVSNRDGWRGQFYGGSIQFDQQAKLTYVKSTPPGISFSGGINTVSTPAQLGARLSIRELSSTG